MGWAVASLSLKVRCFEHYTKFYRAGEDRSLRRVTMDAELPNSLTSALQGIENNILFSLFYN